MTGRSNHLPPSYQIIYFPTTTTTPLLTFKAYGHYYIMSGWNILWVLAGVSGACTASYLLAPSGQNQT